ncbi:MAG: hypothetical protein MUF07_15295 [Steroidobacteraceae bacterium]|nr:hypothetical protein [Steroidobacteraceae bacterium]
MKKSDAVILAVIGSVYGFSLFSHGDVYQDRYRSREDCEKDWGRDPRDCQPEAAATGSAYYGGGFWRGPRYEEGARPPTAQPGLRDGRTQVMRGGFGTTGARYTRGGS